MSSSSLYLVCQAEQYKADAFEASTRTSASAGAAVRHRWYYYWA